MGSGQKRPVIMDGYKRFESISKAAAWIKENTNTPAKVAGIRTNIWKSLEFRKLTAYGHYFQDDIFLGMTPREYESIIAKQREALQKQHRLIVNSREHNAPLNQKAVLASQKLLSECGVEA